MPQVPPLPPMPGSAGFIRRDDETSTVWMQHVFRISLPEADDRNRRRSMMSEPQMPDDPLASANPDVGRGQPAPAALLSWERPFLTALTELTGVALA